MSREDSLASTTHLVSHLLREVESAIRDALQPLSDASDQTRGGGTADERHRLEITRALGSLDIPEDHPVAAAWLRLPGRNNEYGFAARAHRDNLAAPRPIDDEFRLFWKDMESVLACVLDRLEANYLSAASLIGRLRAIEKPSIENAREFIQHVPHAFTAHQEFFAGMANPAWLAPLRAVGAFRRAPPAVTGEKDGRRFISYPGWPEGEFLERMAAIPAAQGIVAEILADSAASNNLRVHYHFAGAALALPPEATVSWVEREILWLQRQESLPLTILGTRLGELAAHLALGQRAEQAFGLFRSLLALQAGPAPGGTGGEEIALLFSQQPRSHIDAWHYLQIIEKATPALAAVDDLGTLARLCDLLEEAITLSGHKREAGGGDTSYIWRRAVEDDGETHAAEFANALITGLRRAAEFVVSRDPAKLAAVLQLLESRAPVCWIFSRVALHLLRVRRTFDERAVADRLTDPSLFHELSVRHEYTLLLREAYPHLMETSQTTILRFIEDGPIVQEPDRFSEKELTAYQRTWTRDRLAPIAPFLSANWKARYEALVSEFGESRHPEYPLFISFGGFLGSETPKTSDELRTMSVESIAEFLQSWEPDTAGIQSSSFEGIAQAIAGAVKEDPGRFAAKLNLLSGIDPTYDRGLLEGFSLAAQGGLSFEWRPVIGLCLSVVERPAAPPPVRGSVPFDRDPDWRWAREVLQMLLESGLGNGPSQVPFDLRAETWKAIVPLTSDPDPTPEREADVGARSDTRFERGQFGLRGRALRTVVKYATWVRQHLVDQWRGFESAPEAGEVLAAHLDLTNESSVAVRSLYGELLPVLFWLDRGWVDSHWLKVFPQQPEYEPFRLSAWNTYLRVCRPVSGLLDRLKGEYSAAIARISDDGPRPLPSLEAALSEHLMVLYGLGELGLKADGLVEAFFDRAPDRLRAHAISFVGQKLAQQAKSGVSEDVLARFRSMWVWRLRSEAQGSDRTHELLAFGRWFASGVFDAGWAADQLLEVYEKTGAAPPEYWVLLHLAEIAQEVPAEAAQILRAMAARSSDALQFSACRAEVTKALKPALEGSDADARATAIEAINRLASRGASEFASLLSPPSEPSSEETLP